MISLVLSALLCSGAISAILLSEHQTPLTKASVDTAPAPGAVSAGTLLRALQAAVTEEERLNILVPDPNEMGSLTFQFVNNTVVPPNGGTVQLAAVTSFPALLGTNVAMALGFVNPCGLNVPHSHPRANEFLTMV